MRISDWSSDVCSSDLRPNCSAAALSPTRNIHVRSRASAQSDQPPGDSASTMPGSGLAIRIRPGSAKLRSEEHTSELQSLMRISYAVFCLKKKTKCNLTILSTTTSKTTVYSYLVHTK